MGCNSSKVRIIEFNGLPGTGKTTIARILGDKLIKDNKGPIHYYYYRYMFHTNRFSFLLSPRYSLLFCKLWLFSRRFKEAATFNFLFSVIRFVRMYHHYLEDNINGYLIVDQGFVQSLISIAYNERFPDINGFSKIIRDCDFARLPILYLNCSCNPVVNIERLRYRVGNYSRIQNLQNDELKKVLNIQNDNLSILRSVLVDYCPNAQFLCVDTERRSPEENAAKIFDYCCDILNNRVEDC